MCENIPNSRKVCRSVQVPQPPIVSLVDFCHPKRLLPPGGADNKLQDGVQEAVLHGQQAGLPPAALPVQCKPHLTQTVPDMMLGQVVQQKVCPTCMEPSYPGRGCGTPTCQNPGTIGMGGSTLPVFPQHLPAGRTRRQAPCDGGTCGGAGGQGYNLGVTGGQGYNPGVTGGQGYNPGVTGGQGYNPGAGGCGNPVPSGGNCGVGPDMCGQCRQQQVTSCY